MSGYVLKSTRRDAVCVAGFASPVLRPSEYLVEDLGWLVIHAAGPGGEAIVTEQVLHADSIEGRICGGTAGDVYMLTAQARTSLGRVLRRSFVLRVAG